MRGRHNRKKAPPGNVTSPIKRKEPRWREGQKSEEPRSMVQADPMGFKRDRFQPGRGNRGKRSQTLRLGRNYSKLLVVEMHPGRTQGEGKTRSSQSCHPPILTNCDWSHRVWAKNVMGSGGGGLPGRRVCSLGRRSGVPKGEMTEGSLLLGTTEGFHRTPDPSTPSQIRIARASSVKKMDLAM